MAQPITKKDLNEAFTDFSQQIDKRFDVVDKTIQENTREIIQHFNQSQSQLRQDMEGMLADHHQSLTEAITEVILDDKLKAVETDIQQVKDRLTTLEATQ